MSNRVRLGLIGASTGGTWSARAHFPALAANPNIDLAAVCTTRAASAEAAREKHGARHAFADFRALAASAEIDAAAVVVRVPAHYEPVMAALGQGKHVYCEWPLGRTTAEAEEMAMAARARGLVTAVGLQARVNPTLLHMRELIADGYVGEMVAVHVSMLREGILARPMHRTWQRDVNLGANPLTIPNGHTLDATRFVAGEIGTFTATVSTTVQQWRATDTGDVVDVTAPDNIVLAGRMANGAVLSHHVGTIPHAGSGYRMEIYGRKGTLMVAGADSPQLSALRLHGARDGAALVPLAVPERFRFAPPGTPEGDPANVGQMYSLFARAIGGEHTGLPDFAVALRLHQLLDAVRESSYTGRAVSFG